MDKSIGQSLGESSAHTKKYSELCAINNPERAELKNEILFLEAKYQKCKRKLAQRKLLGQLSDLDVQEMGNLMNIIAMKYSQDGNNKTAQEWLRRTLKYCELNERVRIVTYNNMACVYKQANDLPMALLYINKAQKEADFLCLEMEDDRLIKVITDCSLNLCAILSAMGEHYKALKAARKALSLLKSSDSLPCSYIDSLFPMIKYNEAVELERLKMYEEAETAYMEAQQSLSVTPQLAERLRKAIEQVGKLKEMAQQKFTSTGRMRRKERLSLPKFRAETFDVCPFLAEKQKQKKSQLRVKISTKGKSEKKNYASIEPIPRQSLSKQVKENCNYESMKPISRQIGRALRNALCEVENI